MSTFFYFGFGSNMLAKRLHMQNPSAVRVSVGRLDDYRLDFYTISRNWMGSPATIVPTCGSCVFGAIWEMDSKHIRDLDRQEGVDIGQYIPISVPVHSLSTGKIILCRTYHLSSQPAEDIRCLNQQIVPPDRQPSKSYLKAMVKGAIETRLPQDYVCWLSMLKHNGKMVEKFEKQLGLSNVKLNLDSTYE